VVGDVLADDAERRRGDRQRDRDGARRDQQEPDQEQREETHRRRVELELGRRLRGLDRLARADRGGLPAVEALGADDDPRVAAEAVSESRIADGAADGRFGDRAPAGRTVLELGIRAHHPLLGPRP
jgi:hypothetical protein